MAFESIFSVVFGSTHPTVAATTEPPQNKHRVEDGVDCSKSSRNTPMPTTMKQFFVKTGKMKRFSIMSALPFNKSMPNSSDILVEKIVPKFGMWGKPNFPNTTQSVGQDTVNKIGGFRGYCHCYNSTTNCFEYSHFACLLQVVIGYTRSQ